MIVSTMSTGIYYIYIYNYYYRDSCNNNVSDLVKYFFWSTLFMIESNYNVNDWVGRGGGGLMVFCL